MEITDKIAYSLGFLWADGYLTKGTNNIGLFLKSEDFNEIKDIIFELIPYNKIVVRYTNDEKHREQSGFNYSNKEIAKFLTENDFREKSVLSAEKILNLIPKNKICYFLRGFFDGDGSVDSNRNNVISFTGSYKQDWDWLITLFNGLEIKNKKYTHKSNNGSLSRITLYNIQNCLKFFDYIYPNRTYDFGLKRKYDRLCEISKKISEEYIYKNRRNGITEVKYFFINNNTRELFEIVGEKKVYEFFKEKNQGLTKKEKYCGQKIIDKENTTQKDITFLRKERVKKIIYLQYGKSK